MQNFPCADLICKFCGHLAQVKAVTLREGQTTLPTRILGAAWNPVREQMEAGIFHDLYLVGFSPRGKLVRIERVSAETLHASPDVLRPREPLKATARRAGWQGRADGGTRGELRPAHRSCNSSRGAKLVEGEPKNRRREKDQGGESTGECGHPQ